MISQSLVDVTVADGKYRLVQDRERGTKAFRYGEEWLDVTVTPGSNMILAMAYELEELRERLNNSGDRAIAIGEEAFKAGWDARSKAIDDYLMHGKIPDVEEAWSAYEPSEDIKALV